MPCNLLMPPIDRKNTWNPGPESLVSAIESIAELLKNGNPGKALQEIEKGLHKHPDDPGLLYLSGSARYMKGDFGKARQDFTKAKDLDFLPSRALSTFNEFIRSKAGVKGVYIFDIEKAFENASPNGITGYNLIMDNCHPTMEGNFIIARGLMEIMRKEGFIEWEEDVSLYKFLYHSGFFDQTKSLSADYYSNIHWYCAKWREYTVFSPFPCEGRDSPGG
jgi:tetratricopeptide (TPR) repeat protein